MDRSEISLRWIFPLALHFPEVAASEDCKLCAFVAAVGGPQKINGLDEAVMSPTTKAQSGKRKRS